MSLYRLTATAVDDLAEISAYLTEQGGDSLAFTIENELFTKFETLAAHPGLGHRRSDLTRLPFVFFPWDPYLIVYQRDCSPILIHAVLHGARDLKRILRKRGSKKSSGSEK